MERKHIEFVQSQNVDWLGAEDGTEIKLFSEEPTTGDRAALIRCPAGWQGRLGGLLSAEEFYVLDGAIEIGGEQFGRNYFGFLPEREGEDRATQSGALILSFRYAANDPTGRSDAITIDAAAMPWDVSTLDPKLTHLRLARKILRLGPENSGRTYLLAGLPHGFPGSIDMQIERHPHAEEMFLIQGEMKAPEGVMRDGAYFYRPAGIDHGPHISEFGFLMLMRTRGSNVIVTEWSDRRQRVPIDPEFQPRGAIDIPDAWRSPMPARPVY